MIARMTRDPTGGLGEGTLSYQDLSSGREFFPNKSDQISEGEHGAKRLQL